MKRTRVPPFSGLLAILLLISACATSKPASTPGPLPGWNEGPARQSIVDFIGAVSDPDSSDYVLPGERIAVFDNDGTLWSEKPLYFQMLFVFDRVKAMAPDHPEWAEQQPFKAVIENDRASLEAQGEPAFLELFMATHAGMTTAAFDENVRGWLVAARHPDTGRAYTQMVYQPMLELLDYLRAHQFKVFIVSGGGISFMRPWTESVYGIPPHQVVGTSIEMTFDTRDGHFVIDRKPEIHHFNDKAGKPVGIERFIGRRPIMAVGNSDGDLEMLQWSTAGKGRRLGVIVHHTDGEREWAYDRNSAVGRLDMALDAAPEYGWTVIDMARDWRTVYPPE